MTTGKGAVELLADDPLQSPEGDLLDHERFAQQMAQVLDSMRSQTDSGVLVLAGPWGSGKSSVLNMLETRLQEGGWSAVSFNPWLLSDEASLIQQFFGSLSTALPSRRKGKKLRKKLASYVAAVAPVARVVQLPLVDLGEAAEATASFLAGDQGLDRKYQDLSDALQELEHPAVVLVDDLDRLHPDELILVFKLVRLIGRLPNIYYILAFDEETVVDLLTASDITGESPDRGYAFLEKIYQVRLELPPLHRTRRSQLVDLALQSFLERTGASFGDDDKFRFATSYHDFMASHLSTPRQIKRYVAQAEIYYPFVQGEVDLVDFLLVTFLRSSLPRLYDLVASSKNELTRTIESVFQRENRTLDQQRTEWEEKLGKEAGIVESEVASALRFLAQLFLPIRSVVELTQFNSDFYDHLAQHKQVGSADYFDRYFYLGVQPDDVSDRLVEAALGEFAEEPGPAVNELRRAIEERGSAVFEKLVRSEARLDGRQRAGVFHLLADVWDALPDAMFVSARRRSVILGVELLPSAEADRIDLDTLVSTPSSLLFTGEVLSRIFKPDDGEAAANVPEWVNELRTPFLDRAFGALDDAATSDLEGQEEWVVPLLFRLRDLAPQRVTDWLQANLGQTAWSVEDLAAAVVPIATAYGGGRPTKVLAHADVLGSLQTLLPINWVIERITGLEETGERLNRLRTTEEDLTFENRLQHVKAVLRQRIESGELSDGQGDDKEPGLEEE